MPNKNFQNKNTKCETYLLFLTKGKNNLRGKKIILKNFNTWENICPCDVQ
jgi:hypothetical protein